MTWHLKVNFSCALYRPGKWLWVDSNGTNGNTTFCRRANLSWLSAICIRFREIAAWIGSRWRCSSKSWRFLEKRPLTGKFSKMFSERIHGDRSTSCVQILWNLADQKSVKSCIAYLTKKKQNFSSRSCSHFCVDRAQNLPGSAPDNILGDSECPKFHPNPFTSGGVIAKRLNVVETCHKVSPILGEATASSLSNKGLIW